MTEYVLIVEGLRVSYGSDIIIRDISVQLAPGRSLAILGPSGSGKTTLLLSILGLIRPTSGRIFIGGKEMTGAGPRVRARIRRELVGAVFQTGELLPELSPIENVALPALLGAQPVESVMRRAKELLTRLGVDAEDRPIGTYSGGEQQRMAVARALINSPALVVADEPTGSLDDDAALAVKNVLFELPNLYQCGLVMVTHDRRGAFRADKVLEFNDGELREVEHAHKGR
jgi:lipoprotein-releasing system ATP-binding protein